MAEKKNMQFDRPGGYAAPKGATQVQRKAARDLANADIKLYGDSVPSHYDPKPGQREATPRVRAIKPHYRESDPDTQLHIGDCRDVLANLPEKGEVDLIFADPPFNWEVPYAGDDGSRLSAVGSQPEQNGRQPKADSRQPAGGWNDGMPRAEYERFTFDWLDGCIEVLAPHGSLFVNVPDDIAAECVMHLKRRGLVMINWCIWHFRFGQCRDTSFIMSKVHVLYFAKLGMKALRHEGMKGEGGMKASRHEGRKGKSADHSMPQCLDASMPAVDTSMPSCLNASMPALDRIWNPNDILELSDRASIYADPRTMAKESNKGMRVPMDVWYGKYWGRIQGNNKERRHNHHNQIPEVYLERVIKCASNPGGLVLDPFCGSGTTSTVARALGRRSITIEYSKVNAKSAWERITKVGMVQREDNGPQSSAIFENRRRKPRAKPAANGAPNANPH